MSYLFPMTPAEWRLLGSGVEPLVWGVDQTIVSEERKWIMMSWRVELVLTKCKQAYHRFVFNSRQQLKNAKGFQFSFLKGADCWYIFLKSYRGQAARGRPTGIPASLQRCRVSGNQGHCRQPRCGIPALRDHHPLSLGCSSLLPLILTAAPAHRSRPCI